MTEPAGVEPVRPSAELTEDAYRFAMDFVSNLVMQIRLVDLDQLLAVVDRADALGPILDPTAYIMRGGAKNIADQRAILTALVSVQKVAERIAGPIGGDRG
jgi:hypothetical protein